MLRINQIIKILSGMKPYAPHTYKNKTDRILDKIHGKLVVIGITVVFLLVLFILLHNITEFFKTEFIMHVIFYLYLFGVITGLLIMILPPILGVKHFIDWKKEAFNDFVCEIFHDEENSKLLLDYSEKELLYVIHWLSLKTNRITMRISGFFGEKTAVLSILALCYSAVQSSIGFDKLSKTLTEGSFTSDTANTFIMFGLAFLLGISLGALMLKKVADHQRYLKEIVELTIRMKKDTQTE